MVRRLPVVALAVLAMLAAAMLGSASTGLASASGNHKHFFWAHGQAPAVSTNALANDLIYHGGGAGPGAIGVETVPAVYIVYWGPDWAAGFNSTDANGQVFPSSSLQAYTNSFFTNVGGSPWAGVTTQYCKGVLIGSTSCAGVTGAQFVTNPTGQLKGVWTDPSPVPAAIVALGLAENLADDPIAAEAQKAVAHFGYDPQATYFVLTPPTTVATGQPVYCGYHTQTTNPDLSGTGQIQYSFIPYLNMSWPGVGAGGCGMNFVNKTSNSFGNGVWDGYSIVTGHEYAEAISDPDNFVGNQDGWNDVQGSENGDKCAWTNTQNIALAGNQFAVQPTWSNEAFDAGKNGCAVTR
ncbi:MAG TPA: hypothetical protein VLK30_12885 [Candidatus Limnocylindrales bacterium]|nr:hypothetical protein [Candidatus Limnocylindrales bacterium]